MQETSAQLYAHNEIVSIWTQQCSRSSEICVIVWEIEAVEAFSLVLNQPVCQCHAWAIYPSNILKDDLKTANIQLFTPKMTIIIWCTIVLSISFVQLYLKRCLKIWMTLQNNTYDHSNIILALILHQICQVQMIYGPTRQVSMLIYASIMKKKIVVCQHILKKQHSKIFTMLAFNF